jgi:DNA-binding NtrC family response regulator
MAKIRLLFVDDDEEFLHHMESKLSERGPIVTACLNGTIALEKAEENQFDVALIDLELPRMQGGELLIKLKELDPTMEVIILTGHGSIQSAAECSRCGAFDYLLKPCRVDQVVNAISNAYSQKIKSVQAHKAELVNEIMEQAIGLSPMELLEKLHELDKQD